MWRPRDRGIVRYTTVWPARRRFGTLGADKLNRKGVLPCLRNRPNLPARAAPAPLSSLVPDPEIDGLQLRLARQNMLEAGFELPGLRDLKQALEVLKEQGIDDNTLVVFTSDHGEMGASHRAVGKGPTIYEEQLRMPLSISWPKRFKHQAARTKAVAPASLSHVVAP